MTRLFLVPILLVSACGSPGLPSPSANPRIAVVSRAIGQDVAPTLTLRLSAGQALTPARVAGREEFCSDEPVLFVPAYILERHKEACFFDANRSGRFTEVAVVSAIRVATFRVDVPYTLEEPRASTRGAAP